MDLVIWRATSRKAYGARLWNKEEAAVYTLQLYIGIYLGIPKRKENKHFHEGRSKAEASA